jgi:hypothetical protein
MRHWELFDDSKREKGMNVLQFDRHYFFLEKGLFQSIDVSCRVFKLLNFN